MDRVRGDNKYLIYFKTKLVIAAKFAFDTEGDDPSVDYDEMDAWRQIAPLFDNDRVFHVVDRTLYPHRQPFTAEDAKREYQDIQERFDAIYRHWSILKKDDPRVQHAMLEYGIPLT